MIGDMFNNNKRRNVRTREDQRLFMGKKYAKEKGTGYYVCTSGERKRLHVAMWEQRWGIKVPEGCVIHHLDWNKANNIIENLVCLTIGEHERVHNIVGGVEGKELGYELARGRNKHGLPPDIE